ncbi:MAG TPA: RNase P subunit p30 family protein [Candidatus Nanoarchaeia archaeon]|nr:RNase P subunit p30 family protein [Candidatus Nanoarchaeia archaeon]
MDFPVIQPKTAKEFYQETGRHNKIAVEGYNEEVNKAALENKKVVMLVNPERYFEKDFMDQRGAGLNDVLCRLAAKNNIAIALDIDYLLGLRDEEKVNKLGKIMQNIRLCNKYHVKTVIFDRVGRNKKDLKGFGACLGMKPGAEILKIRS